MIETLQELVNTAGVARMNLSIQPLSDVRVAVAIQCVLGPEPEKATDDQRELRKALAQAILVEGVAGEVDAKLDSLLIDYVRAVHPHTEALITNIEVVTNKVEKAGEAIKAEGGDSDTQNENKPSPSEAEAFTTEDEISL